MSELILKIVATARSTTSSSNRKEAVVPKGKHRGAKQKSRRQVGYLLSSGSPLSAGQKAKLKRELHSGAVKIKKGGKRA